MLTNKQYNILIATILGLLILNFLVVRSTILGSCALAIFLILASLAFSNRNGNGMLFGFLTSLSLIIITTSISYLIFGLTTYPLLVILLLVGGASCMMYNPTPILSHAISWISLKKLMPIVFIWMLAFAGFVLLYTARTTESVVSPWIVVHKGFFILLFLLSAATLLFTKNDSWAGLTVLPVFVLGVSVVLVVYKIGYGFDQFVHEAALRYIDEYGLITPRTPYYIGEYGLLIFISKFAILPVGLLNKLLLPILFGTLIPLTLIHLFVPKGRTMGAGLILLLLPLTPFIATTPQGLANLFLILLILVGWLYLQKQVGFFPPLSSSMPPLRSGTVAPANSVDFASLRLPILLALATIFTHIIAGIPAVIFLAFIYLAKNKTLTIRTWLFIFVIGSLAIPALFAILSFVQPNLVQIGLHTNLQEFLRNLFDLGGRYNFWLDIVYLNKLIISIFLFCLLVFGLYELKKEYTRGTIVYKCAHYIFRTIAIPYLALFGILLIDFLITFLFFSFPSLIRYEQSDFALRFFEMSFYFLIPIIFYGGAQFFARLQNFDRLTRGITVVILAIFVTSSVYLSYPRKDAYDVSHGFSTSSHDLAAVRAIEKDAQGTSYIVLANQAVGSAALREFGFSRAYLKTKAGEVYFYSIPTGGELYKYYLQMVYDAPRASIAREAAEFSGADVVYLVIDDYWWNSKKLIEIAKQEAKDSKEIDGGKVWIFRY